MWSQKKKKKKEKKKKRKIKKQQLKYNALMHSDITYNCYNFTDKVIIVNFQYNNI